MTLAPRQHALLLVTLLYERDPVALFTVCPRQSALLTEQATAWLKEPPELRKTRILRRLKKLEQLPTAETLDSVHVDWLHEALAKESPRAVAWIVRLLPPAVVSRLSSTYRKAVVDPMPPLPDPAIARVLLERFLAGVIDLYASDEVSPLAPLAAFPAETWDRLFQTVAYEELSIAFHGLKKSAYIAILHRLPLADAKAIGQRISALEERKVTFDKRAQQTARMHLVSLDIDKIKAEELPVMLGMYLFSKAVWGDRDASFAARVAHRFPQKRGRLLLRFVKRHRSLNTQRSVVVYQRRFLKAVEGLL